MRNFVGELKQQGYSFRNLAAQSGLSARRVSALARGAKPTRAEYLKTYNINRKIGYQKAREAGFKSEVAREKRVKILGDEVREFRSTRKVKSATHATHWQLRILAEFRHRDTKKLRISEGYSFAHPKIAEKIMMAEAINEALARLGSTHWDLVRMIEKEYMKYKLVENLDDAEDSEEV